MLEHSSDVLDMIVLVLGEDQDVVEVNKNEPINNVSEQVIDECLEDRRGVWKAKRAWPNIQNARYGC